MAAHRILKVHGFKPEWHMGFDLPQGDTYRVLFTFDGRHAMAGAGGAIVIGVGLLGFWLAH